MTFKRILSIIMVLVLFSTNLTSFAAVEEFSLDAGAGIMVEINSNTILYEKNAYDIMYPASTTKILTAILVLENLQLDDIITINQSDIDEVYPYMSGYWLKNGEEFTVEELLYLLLLPSANDAAVAFGRTIAGSTEAFAEMMNEKAKELGAISTHFTNAHGLPEDDHYTTAYDLSLIAQYALTFDTFVEIVGTTDIVIEATNKTDAREVTTSNKLIIEDSGMYNPYNYGMKTGFTNPSGNCFVGIQRKDDMDLLTVVLYAGIEGGNGVTQRFTETTAMSNWGFDNFAFQTLVAKDDVIMEIPVNSLWKGTSIKLTASEDITALLPIDFAADDVEYLIETSSDITKSIDGGGVTLMYNGESYGQVNMVASGSCLAYTLYNFDMLMENNGFKLIAGIITASFLCA